MKWPSFGGKAGVLTGLTAILCLPAMALGQDLKTTIGAGANERTPTSCGRRERQFHQ